MRPPISFVTSKKSSPCSFNLRAQERPAIPPPTIIVLYIKPSIGQLKAELRKLFTFSSGRGNATGPSTPGPISYWSKYTVKFLPSKDQLSKEANVKACTSSGNTGDASAPC